jgi:ATP-dependent protease HslVU (ClpYQ) peptidase subunit
MTCIAALVHNGTVHMGGDSAGVGGYDLTLRADPKVFVHGVHVIGFTTSFRMGQIIQYHAEIPDPAKGCNDLMEHMVTKFIPAVRTALKKHAYTKVDNNREEGGTFLVGVYSHLFMVGSDFQVGESLAGIDAVGCGADYALGAMAAAPQRKPIKRLELALGIAEKFSAGVRRPFIIRRTP